MSGQPFVNSELNRFVKNNQDSCAGHNLHSPTHNRVDSIRDDSVYKSVGGDKSASGTTWSLTAASSNFSKLKLKLQS